MKRAWATILTALAGTLLLCSCEPARNSKCASLLVTLPTDKGFSDFLDKHQHVAPHYGENKIRQEGKNDDLKDIGRDRALDQAETASLTFVQPYRMPFKKWYYVNVSVRTKDGLLVKYSELIEPDEYKYFCTSEKFVISGRRVFKTMSVEPAR